MARIDLSLTPHDLQSRTWTFGHRDHPPHARFVRLLANGRITGFPVENVNERRWTLDDGKLAILDAWDRRTTVFDETHVDDEGRLTLLGGFRFHPVGTPHKLQEIPSPDTLKPNSDGLVLERQGSTARRRNLVIIRANEHSVHHQWPRDIVDEDRNWDLFVSFYGKEENYTRFESEYQTIQNKDFKYPSIYDLLYVGSPLWEYDYVAMTDDDLMMSWRDWNELFAICREYNLLLAQPALNPNSFVAHVITARQWNHILRFTSFVEAQVPIFSREALLACAPTFRNSKFAFGLDHIWPKLLGEPRAGIAVIDKVPVVHTRPPGGTYDIGEMIREGDERQRVYDAPNRIQEYGGVLERPTVR